MDTALAGSSRLCPRAIFRASPPRAITRVGGRLDPVAAAVGERDPDVEAFRAAMTGQPPRTVVGVLHDLASVPDKPWWDPAAERGSERNPVRLDTAQPAGQPEPRRSAQPTENDRLIGRYHELAASPVIRRARIAYHEARAYGRGRLPAERGAWRQRLYRALCGVAGCRSVWYRPRHEPVRRGWA